MEAASLNTNCLKAEYAVRGPVPIRAELVKQELAKGDHSYSFDKVIPCNIGNPHALNQKPLTFVREVVSLLQAPHLLDISPSPFSAAAVQRARAFMDKVPAGVGAYTHSQGYAHVRQEVADFLERRDGHSACISDIYLTDGASAGVKMVLQLLSSAEDPASTGFLIPIPQYPLYSAVIALLGATAVPYYLDESRDWAVDFEALDQSVADAEANGISIKAICVINPGNPTGNLLAKTDMQRIVDLAHAKGMVIMADEVYQENVYGEGEEFVSFKKVVRDMSSEAALVSFHSVSKGYLGECGYRGGYFELVNIPLAVRDVFYKLASIGLCPNTAGQLVVSAMVNPPDFGDEGELFQQQKTSILASLKRRAGSVATAFNSVEGMSCARVAGALYAFPSVVLPPAVEAAASAAGLADADTLFCMRLLESTGVCVVPGSGFGQRAGTHHFRMTILPEEHLIEETLRRIGEFYLSFVKQYK
ncbi:hypothetical protein KIPB_006061 [Kipferlia bialata]|uniref:Aminotransferase class I/classII large domain-containing protein n=1 Tax=Kipferlia bialata TaxID=797122 RepID=A0A9K3CXZ4_9EUKA|nr:hypothetical protein KIPB_006061 [Kipferlia bialata]|eukprot:g6061.t1